MDVTSMSTEELQEICRQDANNPEGLSWSELEPILAEIVRRQRQTENFQKEKKFNSLKILNIILWVVCGIAAVAILLIVFLAQRPIITI